ncbi:ciliated left-right organizer metallopeptidase-like isoform X2 [Liolophura sinensis]|uniref:ciliated left-right organizer metallopeptidase-like isoform X2 n=1 Tax=Liolophura sinensis TaxID=3198878 RepID=UPI003158C24E
MMRWLNRAVGCVTLIVLISVLCEADSGNAAHSVGCIFDEIQTDELPKTVVNYVAKEEVAVQSTKWRSKRRTENEYAPIRITPFFTGLEDFLNPAGQERLKSVVIAAIQKISNLLSVIPVKGPLRLARYGGCQTSWKDDTEKCYKIDAGYRGEFCGGVVQIPDDHLEGLYTWQRVNSSTKIEHVAKASGKGVSDADYILYVQSGISGQCKEVGLIAYALHCQLDQYNRPIAGYVNFCSDRVESESFDHEKYYLTAIHELFHALGFSRKMFRMFQECDSSDCTGVLGGVTRLITPAVVRETQRHFNCPWEQDFGAPLQMQNGKPSSHWHPRFLQGSIMTPAIGQPKLTLLDRITLALFEDTGWYKVDYSQADNFTWGKGEGCEFGQQNTCQTDSDYFCTGSGLGCHYTHLTKAHCDTNENLRPCRIYLSDLKDSCSGVGDSPSPEQLALTGEEYTSYSRCFSANLTFNGTQDQISPPTGMCFQHACLRVDVLMVKTATSDWLHCPFGEKIYVPGYSGSLQCPKQGVLCTEAEMTTRATTTTSGTSTTRLASTKHHHSTATTSSPQTLFHDDTVHVTLVFPSLDFNVLKQRDLQPSFVDAVFSFVVRATNITERRLSNVNLHTGIVLIFDVLPAQSREEGPTSEETFSILLDCVEHDNFTVQLPELGTHKATEISKSPQPYIPMGHGKPHFSPGGIAGVVVGAVALLIALVVIIFIINKYKWAPPISASPGPRCSTSGELTVVYTQG